MPTATAERLRIANTNLRAGLARLSPESNTSAPLNPEDLSRLLTDLLCAGACLRSIPPEPALDGDLGNAISEYRSIVEQIAQALPQVQGRLIAEKARLQIVRQHVAAAAAWSQASRKTL